MKKKIVCDGKSCLTCERPMEECHGGRGPMSLRAYHSMTDGKKGENMPELHWGRGHKLGR